MNGYASIFSVFSFSLSQNQPSPRMLLFISLSKKGASIHLPINLFLCSILFSVSFHGVDSFEYENHVQRSEVYVKMELPFPHVPPVFVVSFFASLFSTFRINASKWDFSFLVSRTGPKRPIQLVSSTTTRKEDNFFPLIISKHSFKYGATDGSGSVA